MCPIFLWTDTHEHTYVAQTNLADEEKKPRKCVFGRAHASVCGLCVHVRAHVVGTVYMYRQCTTQCL